jgi:thymidylate kinase
MAVSLSECYTAILDYLEKGYVVISDRFIASYYAYNFVANNDVTAGNIFNNVLNNSDVFKGCDLEIILECDLKIIKERLSNRYVRSSVVTDNGENENNNYIDELDAEYFNEVRNGYNEYKNISNSNELITILNESTMEDFNIKIEELYLDLRNKISVKWLL